MFDRSAFRAGYASFLKPGRILLTGHSHQAWPDVARDAMIQAFDDAAREVDDKWTDVFAIQDRVGRRILARLGFDADDAIAFGKSTHELVFRLLTSLPRDARVVTTTGEFHSMTRQLRRLEEDGLRVTWVDADDRGALLARLENAVEAGCDLLAVSAVLYEDGYVVPALDALVCSAVARGTTVLVDAYHAFNVVPLSFSDTAKRGVFVTAGGYKYAALGEGVCFMRIPPGCALRPAYTGWFADFASLEQPSALVTYGEGGARFSGATFDPVSLYRADAVLGYFDAHGLDVATLRAISLSQTALVLEACDRHGLEVASPREPERRGGFVAIRAADAKELVARLRREGVFVDARHDKLRIGPAPYLEDDEILRGVDAIARASGR